MSYRWVTLARTRSDPPGRYDAASALPRIYFVSQRARGIYGGRFRFACFYGAPKTFHDGGIRFRSRFLDRLGALRQRASKVSGRIIGSNYQNRGNQLSDERFDRGKYGEP